MLNNIYNIIFNYTVIFSYNKLSLINFYFFDFSFNLEYKIIIFFLIFLFFFVLLLLLLSFFLNIKTYDIEKNSPYECGFNPFEDARESFEVHFYLVSILFIIFDLEISFLFPIIVIFRYIGFFGLFIIIIFLFILLIGFIYELLKGGLDWN